ncbi:MULTISPECIES: MoaD/ThiS family protein [unclassified Microbacterium]|uniref:MoaD/ThiS family protein n=1 Tax=unclassified Microbacterium TaxID=2609290 RepID=UPI00301B19A3
MARVRYFAAAEEFAGRAEEHRAETTLGALRVALTEAHPTLLDLLPRCAVLVDGRRAGDDEVLGETTLVDVLPPFAGG